MTDEPNPFEDFIIRYYDNPVLFVEEVLGAEPTDYQAEIFKRGRPE